MFSRQILVKQNLHWLGKPLTNKKNVRSLFDSIISEIQYRPMIFLTSIRRVGKSTLMKQVIQTLIQSSVPEEQILFWEWSSKSTKIELEEILDYYIAEVVDIKSTCYIFLDEVQFIEDYENVLKLYYDRYETIRFVLTGSLSFSYKKKMNESLAGRFIEYHMYPLSFEEYLSFAGEDIALEKFMQATTEANLYKKQGLVQDLNPYFRKFLISGRFPDTILYKESYQVNNYLQSILNQSLNQDSIDYFSITKPREINLLYQYICKNNGCEISLNKISQNLGVSWQTVNEYLDILELLGLVYPVLNTDNPLKQIKAGKKVYTNSAFSLNFAEVVLDSTLGFAVESYVLERFLEKRSKIFFYRERKKEIDLIDYDRKLAMEVKFRSNIKFDDYKNLLVLSEKLRLDPCLITLYNTFLDEIEISCLPACLV